MVQGVSNAWTFIVNQVVVCTMDCYDLGVFETGVICVCVCRTRWAVSLWAWTHGQGQACLRGTETWTRTAVACHRFVFKLQSDRTRVSRP